MAVLPPLWDYALFTLFCQQVWLTDHEILATLIAAMIHDFEHTGTTNNFHINTGQVHYSVIPPSVLFMIME